MICCLLLMALISAKSQENVADSLTNVYIEGINRIEFSKGVVTNVDFIQLHKAQIINLIRQNDSINKCYKDTIIRLRKEMDEMRPFVKNSKLYERIKYLNILYSEMSIETLDAIYQQLLPYKDDGDIGIYLSKVHTVKANKKVFENIDSLLSHPLNVEQLIVARERIANIDVSDEQYEEFAVRDTSLSRYAGGVNAFYKMIQRISKDEELKMYKTDLNKDNKKELENAKELCGNCIGKIIEEFRNSYNRYFSRIPYLKEKYTTFVEYLETDPVGLQTQDSVNAIEMEFHDLKVEADKY